MSEGIYRSWFQDVNIKWALDIEIATDDVKVGFNSFPNVLFRVDILSFAGLLVKKAGNEDSIKIFKLSMFGLSLCFNGSV